jgi:hypothetical protein
MSVSFQHCLAAWTKSSRRPFRLSIKSRHDASPINTYLPYLFDPALTDIHRERERRDTHFLELASFVEVASCV